MGKDMAKPNAAEIYEMGQSEQPNGHFDSEIKIQCTRDFARSVNTELYSPVAVLPARDAGSLAAARAVLSERKEAVQYARRVQAYPSELNESVFRCLVALSDALEARDE